MGIPRLTSHLEPFLKNVILGCTNRDCSSHAITGHRDVVVDGPGFAYFIYYKILGRNGATSAIEAQPSYEELGEACLMCLRSFEEFGLDIKHVFFDGGLPISKRDTRLQRLTDTLSRLSTCRSVHGNGFKAGTVKEVALRPVELLCPWSVPLFAKNLPASPFLVPAVFEALKESEFSEKAQLVSGEADIFLAKATRESPGILCLTGDSDMAIHNLGNGALTFFSSLDAQNCSKCNQGHSLQAKVLNQEDLINKIGETAVWEDLVDLGFEIKQNPGTGLDEAVRRIKAKSSTAHKARMIGWTEAFDQFADEYKQHHVARQPFGMPVWLQILDNRTSEVAVQAMLGSQDPPYSYMLPLIEDPTRISAWAASVDVRKLMYTVLVSRLGATTGQIIEMSRSGQRIIAGTIELSLESQLHQELETTRDMLLNVRREIGIDENGFAELWIIYAAVCVLVTYLREDRALPGTDVLHSALGGSKTGKLGWPAIHLKAQIDGYLFSMRILCQVMLGFEGVNDSVKSVLCPTGGVPQIKDIILTASELTELNLAKYAKRVMSLARSSVSESEDLRAHEGTEEQATGSLDTTQTQLQTGEWEPARARLSKQKRKRREVETIKPAVKQRQIKSSQNSFALLTE